MDESLRCPMHVFVSDEGHVSACKGSLASLAMSMCCSATRSECTKNWRKPSRIVP